VVLATLRVDLSNMEIILSGGEYGGYKIVGNKAILIENEEITAQVPAEVTENIVLINNLEYVDGLFTRNL
jgi:hypothetical protein